MDEKELQALELELKNKEKEIELKKKAERIKAKLDSIENQTPSIDINKYRNWAIGIVITLTLLLIGIRLIIKFT